MNNITTRESFERLMHKCQSTQTTFYTVAIIFYCGHDNNHHTVLYIINHTKIYELFILTPENRCPVSYLQILIENYFVEIYIG